MRSLLRRHRALMAAKPSRRAALAFDRLDSRCLLSSIAGPVVHLGGPDGRDLIVDGTPKNDTVKVTVNASTIDVTSSTTVVIKGVPKKSPVSTVTYSTSDVDSINVNGNAGNDTLRNSHGISSRSRSLILARERLYSSIWEGSCRTRSSWPS